MTVCAVKWCHNSTGKHKKLDNITFHLFPVDPVVAACWAEKVRLSRRDATWKPTKSTRICCVHFDEKDLYTTERGRRRIRRNAIPTKCLHIACKDEHRSASLNGVCENVRLKSQTMTESKTILQTTTTISIERIEDSTSDNTNQIVCKEEKPDKSPDEEISENAYFNKHLHVVCKEENSGNSSDDISENNNLNADIFYKEAKKDKTIENNILKTPTCQLQGFSSETIKLNTTMMALQGITSENALLNAHLQIVIKEDNQESDEKRENAILNSPTSSFQEFSSHKAKSNWPTTVREYSEDNNDLDFLYNTPREELLQNQLQKKTLLQIKHKRMIKTLQQKNRRLKKKNKTLQLIIASLRKNKPTKSDICRIMAKNTKDSEDEEN